MSRLLTGITVGKTSSSDLKLNIGMTRLAPIHLRVIDQARYGMYNRVTERR
jgi:hypothetical protein